jgi:hypothetical protein
MGALQGMFVPFLSTEGTRRDTGYQDHRLEQWEMRHIGEVYGAGNGELPTKSNACATPMRELSRSGHVTQHARGTRLMTLVNQPLADQPCPFQ